MSDLYHTMPMHESYPSIGANATDDGREVILSFTNYPCSALMTVPMGTALELANKIIRIANERIKVAA